MSVLQFWRRLSTPDLYRVVAAALVALGLAAGTAALITERHRSGLLADITEVSGPLSVDAQDLYRSLSDADATAANAFLTNGVEPAALRQRYLDDLARATAALTVALREADDEDAARLGVLSDQLPIYTGLVETARSYNRQGVPLGAAYLREASGLMRQTLLPAAQELFESAQRRLVGAQRDAAGVPWPAILLGLLCIAALPAAMWLLARRTNRLINLGLVAAGLVALFSLFWSTFALTLAAGQMDTGRRDGSAQVSLLAGARRAALQARADEALTLIARGSGAEFEKDFGAVFTELIGPDGYGGLIGRAYAQASTAADRAAVADVRDTAREWRDRHDQIRELDDGGDYLQAVKLATATGPDSLATVFGRLDDTMTTELGVTNRRVDRQADRAGGTLTGLGAGLVLLTAGVAVAIVLGFRPRIGEYR